MLSDKPLKVFDQKKEKIHPFLESYIMVINGATKSGKTTVALNIFDIIDQQKKSYDLAVFYSPAGKLDDTLRDALSEDFQLESDFSKILEMMAEWKEIQEDRVDNKKKKLKSLFVFDDATGDSNILRRVGGQLVYYMKLHRHLQMSVIFLQHRVNVVNPTIRGIVRYWILFSMADDELNIVAKNTKLPKDAVVESYKMCVKSLHDYIMVDNFERKIYCGSKNSAFELMYSQF